MSSTVTERRGRHHAGADDSASLLDWMNGEDAAVAEMPDWVRIGGVRLRTRHRYLALKTEAETQTGMRGRVARRRLAAEERVRKLAIRRVLEHGGFDVPAADPGSRGARGAGGGRTRVVSRLPEWRATTTQVAGGFWPFSVGATSPMLGTPLGAHLWTGTDFGCDPLTWFLAGLITAPIAFVLALNGYGKSSLVRRMVLGNIAQGHTTMFLGDIKPDGVELTHKVGGQHIRGGYGDQKINPLAVGALGAVLAKLESAAAAATPELRSDLDDQIRQVAEDMRSRQVAAVAGLIEINRGGAIADFEETLLSAGIAELYKPASEGGEGFTGDCPPILEDLYQVIKNGTAELWEDAGADNEGDYRDATVGLRQSLRALIRGRLGKVFNGQSSETIDIDAPAVCVDVSRVPKGDKKLKAALLLVCWADGFGAIAGAHALADAGLAPRRTFQVVIDELWQVIGAGAGVVDRVDELVRLNRVDGVSLIMVTHSVNDLSAFESAADANRAIGFLEKAQLKFIGPVGPEELNRLSQVTSFTSSERAAITSWASTPPPSDSVLQRIRARLRQADDEDTTESTTTGSDAAAAKPHGTGCFMLKVGADDRAGIPFRLIFTPAESGRGGVHDTNTRFAGVGIRKEGTRRRPELVDA